MTSTTWTGSALVDSAGIHAAVTDGITIDLCNHRHGNEPSALRCAGEEERARNKGGSKWAGQPASSRGPRVPSFKPIVVADKVDGAIETVEANERGHAYVPAPELLALWHSLVQAAQHKPAANLMFVGPSGSGKTDGARYLAALVGLPFTKVDSPSMTDPEAWFGTREIVVQDGVAVTEYRPSDFVKAIQSPGVTLLDEINRVRDEHRNVLLGILDGTRAVMNPLTGEVVTRHPLHFIIMSGNIGLHFTGTNAIDPAFMTRSLTVEFEYMDETNEQKVIIDATGCDPEAAFIFTRFATDTRAKAKNDPDFAPISTRELIEMGHLVAGGLNRDLAVKFAVLNGISSEGGSSSLRNEVQAIWNGVRGLRLPVAEATRTTQAGDVAAAVGWTCPVHRQVKTVPAGTSKTTGRPYSAFKACPVVGCSNTESKTVASSGITVNGAPVAKTCVYCGTVQPAGRTTFCTNCGATI